MSYASNAGQIEVTVSVDAGDSRAMVELSMDPKALSECLGKKAAQEFLASLSPVLCKSTGDASTPRDTSNADHSDDTLAPKDDLELLRTQARVFEYLGLAANHLLARKSGGNGSQKNRMALRVHDDLVRLQGKTPSLEVLARRYGVSVTTLNNKFKEVFGQTIGAYINEYRLIRARIALIETDIAMKVLAAQLGYSHVNHFITAFKRYFGYSPGRLRQRR